MSRLSTKINKLCRALNLKYKMIYLVDRQQRYSTKHNKAINVYVLNRLYPVEEYNRMFPDKAKNPDKQKFVKVPVIDSLQEIVILLELVEIYRAGVDNNG